ncbi:substrate-binding domain-containing protein [Sneathiella sp.]|jgi:autoinducer 2-binding protein LuxP|uniref:substrate-binding domain-containing protein n=1 Tax=Sneathiella sp. TaxID=1964365 RepID=UPI0039E5A47F
MYLLNKVTLSMVLSVVICLSFSQATYADTRFADYWTVEEYQTLYPSEKKKSSAFIERVRQHAAPHKKITKPLRIGVIYPGLQASDYWRRSVLSMKARLDELFSNVEIISQFTSPDTAIAEQAQQLGKFLTNEVDYLVFTLNASRHKKLIRSVLSQNKTKLILQNITTPLKSFSDQQPFQYVGFDHASGTEILAQEYLRRTNFQATYAILFGPRGYVNDMRGGTFLLEMQQHSRMVLADSYYVGFDRLKAQRATLDILDNNPEIDFIFSSSTDIALGVIDGLKERNKLGQVMTNGWGGGDSELEAINRGDLDFTVMRMNDDNGVAMAEAVYLDQIGKSETIPLVFSGDIILVEKGISKEQIMELKKRAFRYSN